jgi:hypothetical protein
MRLLMPRGRVAAVAVAPPFTARRLHDAVALRAELSRALVHARERIVFVGVIAFGFDVERARTDLRVLDRDSTTGNDQDQTREATHAADQTTGLAATASANRYCSGGGGAQYALMFALLTS